MRRKRLRTAIAMIVLTLTGTLGILVLLLKHVPPFYAALDFKDNNNRKKHSIEMQTRFFDLMNAVTNNEATWGTTITTEQLNSYFQEDFIKTGEMESLHKDGIYDPRIAIEQDRLRIGFRYGSEPWSTVISIDLKLWLVAKETNTVAFELQSLKAGAMPITGQSFLDRITEAARRLNIEVTWYRHQGNPVALVRFQADQTRPTVQMNRLELTPGQLLLAGRSTVPQLSPVPLITTPLR